MRKRLVIVCAALMTFLAACNGGGNNGSTPPPGPENGGKNNEPPATTGSVMGKISFEGEATNPNIQMKADPKCPQTPGAKAEDYVVSEGGLENVIVYISSGIEGKKFPVPSEPKVIDQQGCKYIPHAFTVQAGQNIKVINSDDTGHNIHALSEKNTPFNFAQPVKGQENMQKFDKPEMPVKIKCDVHPWMASWVGVFDHPYHTVSGAGGNYEIKLPPGKYKVTAWHEKAGAQEQEVEIKEGGSMEHVNFTFKPAAK